MKKALVIVLAVVMVFSLTACGEKETLYRISGHTANDGVYTITLESVEDESSTKIIEVNSLDEFAINTFVTVKGDKIKSVIHTRIITIYQGDNLHDIAIKYCRERKTDWREDVHLIEEMNNISSNLEVGMEIFVPID